MPFFYKHIVPTGLKRGTRGNQIEKWHFCETVFYKQLFSTSRLIYADLLNSLLSWQFER